MRSIGKVINKDNISTKSTIGERKNSKYKCIVTSSWDDGHRLDLKLARLLLKYKMKATFFIPIHYVSEPLSDSDLVTLAKFFEIGSHTLTHPLLTEIPLADANREIVESKRSLEDILGLTIHGFCYPDGAYDDKIVGLVEKANYIYARTAVDRLNSITPDRYHMNPTIEVKPVQRGVRNWTKNLFKSILIDLRIKKATPKSLFNLTTYAKLVFDYTYENGGVWHLWGHSWVIEGLDLWDDLEEILKYVSKRKDVLYLTNYEVIKTLNI